MLKYLECLPVYMPVQRMYKLKIWYNIERTTRRIVIPDILISLFMGRGKSHLKGMSSLDNT
jgi:hypothetical protein